MIEQATSIYRNARTAPGSALTSVSFADALGLAALAVVGMIVHELRTERLVQILATTEPSGDATVKAADSYPAAA